jgi:hypothetical protein
VGEGYTEVSHELTAVRVGSADKYLSADRDPSPGTDFVRATLSHKGRG